MFTIYLRKLISSSRHEILNPFSYLYHVRIRHQDFYGPWIFLQPYPCYDFERLFIILHQFSQVVYSISFFTDLLNQQFFFLFPIYFLAEIYSIMNLFYKDGKHLYSQVIVDIHLQHKSVRLLHPLQECY